MDSAERQSTSSDSIGSKDDMSQDHFLKHLHEQIDAIQSRYPISAGKAFGFWYAMEGLNLEEDEAYEATSYDGGNDKDIDLFYIDQETERILIGQLKLNLKGTGKGKKTDLLGLIHTTDWLRDPESLEREGRKDLAAIGRDYADAIARGSAVEYVYVYCGSAAKDVQDTARQFNVTEAGSALSRSCRVVDLPTLVSEHKERADQSRRIPKATLSLQTNRHFEEAGDFGRAVVATLSGDQLADLWGQHGDRLFDRNVRLFLGARKGGVNAAIRDTLESADERKNFWAYNNGIAFVCDKYEIKGEQLTLHNFSIVNGCQTTVSIASAAAQAARETTVLARFIAAPENEIDSIIRFTNSQNPIRLWDLSAQDRLQKRLKKALATLPQPYLYVLRKGETRQLVSKDRKRFRRPGGGPICAIRHDLNAQYLAAFRGLPAIAYKDKGKIFASLYDQVFPPQIRPEEVVLVWQAGSVAAEVSKATLQEATQNDDLVKVAILKRGAKFFVLAAMGVLLHERNGKTFLNKLKPDVAVSKTTAGRLQNYAKMALEWYVEAMRDLVDAGTEVTTLVRSQESWTKVRAKVVSQWRVFSLAKKAADEALPKL